MQNSTGSTRNCRQPTSPWLPRIVAGIVAGIVVGQIFPAPVQAVGRMEFAQVNLLVGVLIWVMIIPMPLRIDFAALGQVKDHLRGIMIFA
jgi:ACR3 family arsenite transporter